MRWFLQFGAALIVLVFFGMCGTAMYLADKRRMDECLADGRKEYECNAIVRHNAAPGRAP
jgi:hypothetical protein